MSVTRCYLDFLDVLTLKECSTFLEEGESCCVPVSRILEKYQVSKL